MFNSTETTTKEYVDVLEQVVETRALVLHNDEVNTFEWVIEQLMKICGMSSEQAEQCSMIIHFKGRYAVCEGTFEELKPKKDAFIDQGINATID